MTIAEAIQKASEQLRTAGVPAPSFDAELLLRHILGTDRTWIITHADDPLGPEESDRFAEAIDRRSAREPLQHITGVQEFWGLEFIVGPDVLIPRSETELVVEAALASLKGIERPLIIDLCTGSGCIAISLAKHLPESRIIATDRSERALAVANRNALKHGVADRIRFLEGDLFGTLSGLGIEGRADVITANPPYVRSEDLPSLQPEVRDYEPEVALRGGPEGTEVAERIIDDAPAYLRRGRALIMEMGIGQANRLISAFWNSGIYREPEVLKDLLDIDRVIVAQRK